MASMETTAGRQGWDAGVPRLAVAVLLFVTLIWGSSFLIIKTALEVSGPLFFQGLRYAFAAVALGLVAAPKFGRLTRLEFGIGVLTGLAVALANGLQALGLESISSSKSAFLTALYIPLVPLAQWVFLRDRPGTAAWIGIAMAFAGSTLLAGPGVDGFDLGQGEVMTIVCAVVIAFEIVAIGAFAAKVDSRRVSWVQLVVIAVVTFAAMPLNGEGMPGPSLTLLLCAGGLGLGSVVIHVAMYWAQRRLSPTRATLIYATEPVWAGIIGRLAGDRLGTGGFVGAALIVASVGLAALRRGGGAGGGKTPAPQDR